MKNNDKQRYYFDHNATTPVRQEVVVAMTPYLTQFYGNASSVHSFGREARNALETSRERVASLIGAETDEIFFTGCGTESDNIALAGYIANAQKGRNGLVTSSIEHIAILKTANELEKSGTQVTVVGVDDTSRVNLDALRDAIDQSTALVSVMYANNETGVIQDIPAIAEIAHKSGAVIHTDAVQAAGKIPIDVGSLGVDMLSMSGHKINAPKGIGVLYAKKGIPITPLTFGGSQEGGIRPGTEDVAGVVAFAKALELAVSEMDAKSKRLSAMRDRLEKGLGENIENILFNGRGAPRVPNTSNISIPGVDGEALIFSLDLAGIAASTGSACSTGEVEPSHVLIAMGRASKTASSSLRFSMGWGSKIEDVDKVIEVLPPTVERLRKVSDGL